MTRKIVWRVQEAPTGFYRSFHPRGWPTACFDSADGPAAFALYCEDEYRPANVKTGNHGPITIQVAVRSYREENWDWRPLKKKAATLAEAKEICAQFLDEHPEAFVNKKTDA